MSRIGRLPIPIESGVKVAIGEREISIEGSNGKMKHTLPAGIKIEMEENQLLVRRADDSKNQRSLHGLMRALVANSVHGVSKGFEKNLEIHGVGYRAESSGKVVKFNLGYTHPIDFPVPDGIEIAVEKNTRVTVKGYDRQKVGQVAAEIRALRPPDVYKLKGVRYSDEQLRKKAGKTGAK